MRFDVHQENGAGWQWRLFSENGRCIGKSVGLHSSKAQCLYDIALVMTCAGAAIEGAAPLPPQPRHPVVIGEDV